MSATRNFRTDLTAANRGAFRSATALGRVLTVAAAASAMGAEGVKAGPKGGVVKAGAATITTRGGTTTINQAGQKVVIDWDSFDIDANDAVNFLQPGADSIALNRVLNDLPTNIRGQLTANGNVWIVNQHGVTFHAGAVVNVGSLIATTADIDNADFMAGNYKFDKPGDPNAKIINEGDITFGEAGLAAFVAPSATNRGVIAGRMGKVVIAGNETFAVDLAGDGMWAFTMGEGANAASASNSGRIHNPGGYILISARAAQGMVDSNISVGGVVEATTARVEGGKIVLSGDGFVEVSGELDATGAEAGQVGGSIEVTGDKVHVTATAKIDTSGDAGGGSIKIGGDYQGGGTLKTASRTLVSEGAEIAASAIGQVGDGGEVIVWADEITGFFGSIRATGGANAGDGGFAEVSGKQQLAFDGMVELSARNGLPGELLLDPEDIIITDAAGADDGELADSEILVTDSPGDTFTISDDAIEAALVTASVTIAATNSITQNSDASIDFQGSPYNLSLQTTTGPILLQSTVNPGAGGLTLNAGGDLTISGAITSAGALDFDAGQSITLNSSIASTGGDVSLNAATGANGTVTFTGAVMVDGANIDIATDGAVALGDVSATGALTVTSGGAITQTAAITATDLATFNTSGDAVTLTQANNAFGSVSVDTTFTGATTGDVSIVELDGSDLGAIDANALTISSGGDISDETGAIIQSDGATTLTTLADINISEQGVHDIDGVVTLSADQIVDFSTTGGVTFGAITATNATGVTNTVTSNSGAMAFNGVVATGGTSNFNIRSFGNVTQTGSITTNRLTLTQGNIANSFTLGGANDVASLATDNLFGSNAAISLNDTNGVDLAGVASGSLTITAAAAITDSAANTITNEASLTATGVDFTLDQAGNTFGALSLTGANVSVLNMADLALGSVDLSGALVVNVTGDITDQGAKIETGGLSSFTAAGDINIDALNTHVFTSGVTLSADQVIRFAASGTLSLGSVTATNMTDVVNRITATDGITLDGAISTAGVSDLTLETTDGDILKNAGALTTDVLTVDVGAGDATFITPTVDLNTFSVTSGADISLTVPGGVTVGSVNATNLTVSTGGAIVQEMGASIVLGGAADFTTTGDTVTLTGAGNDFTSVAVDTTGGISAPANVAITDTDGLALGDISAASLTITAGGDVTQLQTTTISATGTTTLSVTGGGVALEDATNDFATVTGTANAIALRDANGVTLEALTANAGSVTVLAAGDVTVATNANISATDDISLTSSLAGSTVSVTGTSQITADSDADDDGDVTLRADAGFVTANSAAAAISGANVTLDGGTVATSATITATAGDIDIDADGAVTLNGAVTAIEAGSTVYIDAGGDIAVTSINANAISAETANGAINQASGVITTADGVDISDFTATANVTLDQAGNDFGGPTALSGQTVTIRDTDALQLDDVTATATFVVTAGGAVSQNAASSVTVTETATITATGQNIDLSNDNDFRSTFVATGADVEVSDTGAIELGAITASTLTVEAGGAVSQSAAATVANETTVTATGQAVDLDTANAFTGVVNVTGGAVEIDNTIALSLGDITAMTLDAVAVTGDVTNSADDVLSVTGTTTITSTAGSVTIASNAMNSEDLRQTVTLSAAGDVSLTGVNSQKLVLGDVTSDGGAVTVNVSNQAIDLTGNVSASTGGDAVTLRSAGDITQTAGAISASDLTVSSGGNTVSLTTATNDVDMLTLGVNGEVTVVEADGLAIGQEAGGSQSTLTLRSTGAITQASSLTVTNNAGLTTEGASITLNAAGNAFGSVSADTTFNMATANTVTINEADATVISGITATSATVTSGGAITQTGAIDASAGGSFTAMGDITLTDATNDFADTGSGSTAAFSGATVSVTDVDTLALGAVVSSASTTITADDAGASGNFSGGLTELRFFDTDGDMVLSSALVLPATVVNFTADSVGAIDAQSLTLTNANTLLDATTSVTFSTGAGAFASLTVNAADGVSQSAAITVSGATDLNAPNSQIALGNGANDFQGQVDADGSAVTLTDANNLQLGLINSDTLTANAGGDITDQGAKIEARTSASFAATGDIIIDMLDTHVFSTVSLSADQITRFAATGSISLDAVSATNMTDVVNRITATDGMTLDGAISTLGLSDLTLETTNGAVLQQSGTLTTDALTLDLGTGDGTFVAGTNDINTLAVPSATNVALTDMDGVTIATVDAATLTVTAGDAIDQQAMSTVTLSGLADLTATGANITLNEATNDFATVDADGADLTFRGANGIELTDIDASGALSVTALSGDISDGGAVTMPAASDVNVAGTTTLIASGAITLDDASNDFGGAVAADGEAITLRDANSIILGDIDAGGALVVEAVAGAITQDGDGLAGEDINAAQTSSFTASTTIALTDASNDFVGAVKADGVDISLVDLNAIGLADIDATNLTITANSIDDGAPVMGANGDVDVTGTAALTARAGDITLDDAANNFGVVNADGATVTLTDSDAIELADIDATTLVVIAGSIDDGAAGVAGADVNVTGTTTLRASTTIVVDDATNDFGGAVAADGQATALRDANNIILGDIDAGGALVVEAVAGAISQDGDGAAGGDINAAAEATFTASTTITLTDASNEFEGAVNAAGTSVSLNDLTAIELADIDATSLTVTAASIDDGDAGAAGEDVNVTGGAMLTASTSITLDDVTNDFGGAVAAGGQAITLRDANSIILGDIDASGVLVVDAIAGAISQDGDSAANGDINAAAEATFTASTTITLTDASNDFQDAVNASGTDVALNDLTAIELADIDAHSLTVAAASIDDGDAGALGADVNVTGVTVLAASTTVTLDDAMNDFGDVVSASGTAITLRDANSIVLGDIDAGGILTVDAVVGAISQDGDGASGADINAAAEANFTAATTIKLTDVSNDFIGLVNADGTDVAIRSGIELQLGDIDAASLYARAGYIHDGSTSIAASGDINVTGTTNLRAGGDIHLNDVTNDFGQSVSFNGVYVTLRDANAIILGEGYAGISLTVTAGGTITDSAGSSLYVDGATTLTAQSGAATYDIALDNDTAADRHDFRGAVNAVGQDIILIDRNGITLGAITTNGGAADNTINVDDGAEANDPGALIVIARGGAITQEPGAALTVTGDTTLEAADGLGGYFDITLTNALNAFDSDNTDAVGDGNAQTDFVTFLGETVTINDTGPFFVFDSVANAGGLLTSQAGDLTVEQLRVNAATGPMVGIAVDGAIDADDVSGGSITLGGAGSLDGAATAASGMVTVDNFAVGALAVASDISTTLTNGDAGAALKVAAPVQTFTFVTVDAFTDGLATDFNALTGSTADQLILERIAFDGDITIAAGDVDLGHIDADDGLFVTALTGDIAKRADADLDFAGSAATGFTVAAARGAADETVALQGFDTLLSVGGEASFTAVSGDVVITRGGAKEVDLQGPVSIAATDAAIEDQNSLILGQVEVDNDLAIRINTDNADAGAEALTQTATQTITVGGDLALITGVGAADRSDVTLTTAGNSFTTVSALADDLAIRGGDAFTLRNSDLSGNLTIGSAAVQHSGDLTLEDIQLDGDLAFDATGATTLNRLNSAAVTGQSGDSLTVTDLNANAAVSLTTTGGDLTVTDAIIDTFAFESADALTVTNLSTAGSAATPSTAVGDITVANIVSASNASFDSTGGALDIDSARIGSTLTLSASGDVTLGAIETGGDLSATSDTASVLIRDAATEAPANIVVDGVQAATIGFASGPLVGDVADDRVTEAVAGAAAQMVDPADFTLQLAIGGDAAFTAAGSVLLPREAASEGGFQNDFMGDVAISAASGDVVIEDANALSFATVTITAGDLSARSNADNTGAGEGITQTAAITVSGAASFVTGDHGGAAIADEAILGDVTLGSDLNDFTGAVSVIANNATLADANSIIVANARVAKTLRIDATSAAAGDTATLADTQSGGATTITSGGSVDLDRVTVGGALTATGQGAGLTANDLTVSGATALTAATTIAIDDALLADATITAGASGTLSDVTAQVINVETGGVTISGLSATTTTITSSGPADIEQISTAAATVTTTDSRLALSQAEVVGPLTVRAGTGAITLADLNVMGDATLDGGAIRSDASGGGETRMRVAGSLDLDGANVDLTDVLILGETALDVTGNVTLDDASFANLTATADGAVTITDTGAAATALTAGDALSVTNMRADALDTDAIGTVTLDAVQITGAADILSTDGSIRLASVQVGGALDAEATTGSVVTFGGTSSLAEVTIAAPAAIALPAFTVEGPTAAAIGVEAALANSPADEARVEEVVTAVSDQLNPALAGGQAMDATLAAVETASSLRVAGTTTITAANDLTLNDADLADATLAAGGAGRLSKVAADDLSVTTGGALTASNLTAGATDLSAGAEVSLDNINLAATKVTSGGDLSLTNGRTDAATLSSGGALDGANLRTGSLTVEAGKDVALDAMQIDGDAAILSADGDIGLGSVAIAGRLTAESATGEIRTTDSDFALAAVTIAAPTSPATSASAPPVSAAVAPQVIGEDTNIALLSVGGDAYFLAAGDIVLVDDAVGVTGDNDFMGGVTALSGGSVMLNDANDLILGTPTGVATPGGGVFDTTGITAAGSLRVEVGGSITDADAPQAVIAIDGGARFVATGGDILLDNETHAIGGAVAATGQNITLTEVGSITLGPIKASGDLMVEAGANNNAAGGTTGDAAIIQDRTVMVANADVGGDPEILTSAGAIRVAGTSTFATGLDQRLTLDSAQLTGNRDLVLDSPANSFGQRLNVARIAGDATIVENSQPGATPGERQIGNFEIGGTTRLTTTNDIVFLGQVTALLDTDNPAGLPERPEDVEASGQGDLSIADEDLRLFITTGEALIIDTTGGGVNSDGGDVRFDRAIDGDNEVAPIGSASILGDRAGLGSLIVDAGAEGEIRFRDFVGAQNPLGDVILSAGDIFAGFTFENDLPDLETANFTPDNRFLFDRLNPQDFFFARGLKVNALRRIEFLTPFRTVENFILLDQYFAVNVASLEFGGLNIDGQSVGPEVVQSFGFIGNDRSRSVGLFPRGPQGGNFQFNDCVIGDVADCTNIPIPNVINNILTPAPPLLGIDTEDLLELFGSFGNEELWGVPQSYYSDFGVEQENAPECPEGSDDTDCSGS